MNSFVCVAVVIVFFLLVLWLLSLLLPGFCLVELTILDSGEPACFARGTSFHLLFLYGGHAASFVNWQEHLAPFGASWLTKPAAISKRTHMIMRNTCMLGSQKLYSRSFVVLPLSSCRGFWTFSTGVPLYTKEELLRGTWDREATYGWSSDLTHNWGNLHKASYREIVCKVVRPVTSSY